MPFAVVSNTRTIARLRKPVRLVAGGTSASKTISILMCLIDTAQVLRGKTIDIVSETFPHIKAGAMADFKAIMQERGYWKDERWHGTDSVYTFETGSTIHFFSADSPSKVHGPRRDILYINEGNNIPWPVADHMIVRTRETIWVDWNPSSTFWAYDEIMENPNANAYDWEFITLTYRGNEALDPNTVARIEAHKHNKAWWVVYGEGQMGDIEGRIYTGWKPVDAIPEAARFRKRGLDWGYTNDPTGIIDVYEYGGGFLLDEQLYAHNYGNERIADVIKGLHEPHALVVADSSEPKSIDELRRYGINIIAANKGRDSIRQGISYVQDQIIYYTKRSIHLKREYERYVWLKDKLTDQFINEPPDVDNHLLDALRYALESYRPDPDEDEDDDTPSAASLLY